jgi:hypothetical protein
VKIVARHIWCSAFEESLAHEPIKESEYEEALEKGRRALPAFYDAYHATWSPRALNEARIDAASARRRHRSSTASWIG